MASREQDLWQIALYVLVDFFSDVDSVLVRLATASNLILLIEVDQTFGVRLRRNHRQLMRSILLRGQVGRRLPAGKGEDFGCVDGQRLNMVFEVVIHVFQSDNLPILEQLVLVLVSPKLGNDREELDMTVFS